MKILIAPQAFKGFLSARAVATAIQAGVFRCCPEATTVLVPVSDGGDGFLDVIMSMRKGVVKYSKVKGPLGDPIEVSWGLWEEPPTAIIELAKICGVAMVPPKDRNPMLTTTFGMGEVIKKALNEGVREFVIGIGGSATNDAGTGLLQALGARFFDQNNQDLPLGGGALEHIADLDLTNLDPRVKQSHFIVGCDVTNRFIGPEGASLVYSPQKGATSEMASHLEGSLQRFADLIKSKMSIDLNSIPGSGAAGGTGGGLSALLGAELCSGIDLVLDKIHFDEHLEDVDLVITGEGRIDSQTTYNKAPIGIAKRAKKRNIPVIAIAGSLGNGYQNVHQHGIEAIIPLSFSTLIPGRSDKLIEAAAEQAIRCFYTNEKR